MKMCIFMFSKFTGLIKVRDSRFFANFGKSSANSPQILLLPYALSSPFRTPITGSLDHLYASNTLLFSVFFLILSLHASSWIFSASTLQFLRLYLFCC